MSRHQEAEIYEAPAEYLEEGTEEEAHGREAADRRRVPAPSRFNKTPTSAREIKEYLEELPEQHKTLSLYCGEGGHKKVMRCRCKGRTCEVCRWGEFQRLAAQYKDSLDRIKWPLLLTFSPKNVPRITQRWVRLIMWAIKVCLRRKYWREAIQGGLLFHECTNIGNGWHPHVHALVDARWIEAAKLEKEISALLGWPVGIDPKRCNNAVGGLRYCLGYVKKSPDIYRVDGLKFKQLRKLGRSAQYAELGECSKRKEAYDRAYKGVRTVVPFGNMFGIQKPEKKPLACPQCGCCSWISEYGLNNMVEYGVEYSPRERKVRESDRAGPVGRRFVAEILAEVTDVQ